MTKLIDVFKKLEKPSTKWTGYFDVYDRHLSKFVGKKPKVLDIGVLGGGSIEMWGKYFGKGTKVVGIDINEECLQYKYDIDAKIILGDQASPEFWDKFFEEHNDFDIIIDDGGHTMDQQHTTLLKCFPKLKKGGVMVVEDTHTSYWQNPWGGGTHRNTFLNTVKELTDSVNQQHHSLPVRSTFNGLYSISFYNSQVVFEKEELQPFEIIESNNDKATS